jgi:hypothetical protein
MSTPTKKTPTPKTAGKKAAPAPAAKEETKKAPVQAKGKATPAKKAPAKPTGPTLEELQATATEFNAAFGMDLAIDIELPEEELKAALVNDAGVVEAAEWRNTEGVSDESWAVLEAIGAGPAKVEAAPATKGKSAGKKAEKAPATKSVAEKSPAKAKATPVKKSEGKTKEETKKAAATPAKSRSEYTRSHALIDALKIGGTKKEVSQKADEFFHDHGGEQNERVSAYMFNYVVPAFVIAGAVVKKDDHFSWTGKINK